MLGAGIATYCSEIVMKKQTRTRKKLALSRNTLRSLVSGGTGTIRPNKSAECQTGVSYCPPCESHSGCA